MTKYSLHTTIPDTPIDKGLTQAQVAESRRVHGANILTPPPKPSLWLKLVSYFKDPLIEILLVALMLSVGISVYEYVSLSAGASVFLEPAGILMAVLLATLIGFWLEVSANRKFDVLNRFDDDMPVKVVREGAVITVPRRDVVVGDVVLLESGDEVPADGILVDSLFLAVNESTLTGEPQVHKSHHPDEAKADATYPTNMVLRGTTVVDGRATMVVSAVGDNTEHGHVFRDAQIDTGVKTPLTMQFERLGRVISIGSYIVGALIIVGRCMVHDWSADAVTTIDFCLKTIMLAVTLIVVSVPEGLPMSVTLSLALSMRRMLATNNLVRKLHACETMGATTVICTDKTGTLTQNRMSVAATSFDEAISPALLAEAIAVNTTAHITPDAAGNITFVGNPTEGALLSWLRERGYDYKTLREEAPQLQQLPFSTRYKFMATLVRSAVRPGATILYIKGAPEIVKAMCEGSTVPDDVNEMLTQYQHHAYRTLAFAYAVIPADAEVADLCRLTIAPPDYPLSFMGICGIADPVRADVPAAIKECIDAGIKVTIVTGDTPGTAAEVGRQVGLDCTGDDAFISGPEFAALSDAEAERRAAGIRIMSRARPDDKLRLVNMLQRRSHVVAVTGDGTNDAPALNAAQVGLAMGDGTAVAKEAGDIIILDNSFASISKAVMWGRSLYQNIQRFILFQLTVNVVACLVVAIGAFVGAESPLTVTQMLWVNLIMDTFAALALASLPPSRSVMRRKPRAAGDFIITGAMARFIIGVGLLFTMVLMTLHYLLEEQGGGVIITSQGLTVFFTVFVFMQFWNLFNARAFGSGRSAFHNAADSKVFFSTLTAIFLGQVLIVYLGGPMFNVVPIPFATFMAIFGLTSPIMLFPEAIKLVKKSRG